MIIINSNFSIPKLNCAHIVHILLCSNCGADVPQDGKIIITIQFIVPSGRGQFEDGSLSQPGRQTDWQAGTLLNFSLLTLRSSGNLSLFGCYLVSIQMPNA